MTEPWWRWFLKPQGLAALVLVALLLAGGAWRGLSWLFEQRQQSQQVTALLKQGQLQADLGITQARGTSWSRPLSFVLRPAKSSIYQRGFRTVAFIHTMIVFLCTR